MNFLSLSVVKKYAFAYMTSSSEGLEEKISDLKKMIESIRNYSFYLKNPTIPFRVKKEIIDKILPHSLINSQAYRFLMILINSKVFYFDEILKECEEIVLRSKNKFKLLVNSRYPLSENEKALLKNFFSQTLNMEPVIEWSEKKDCIGGFILRWDDMIIDSTLLRSIEKLKHAIIKGE